MNKRAKFSLAYFLTFTGLILVLDLIVFGRPKAPEIAYSEFRARVTRDEVQSVVMTDTRLFGLMKPEEGLDSSDTNESSSAQPEPAGTPWRVRLEHLEAEREDELKRRFTVVPVVDDGLLSLLDGHGVEYRRRVESGAVLNFLLNWIVPFVLLFFLWGFLMRRMSRGPGMLTLGKNKARVYNVEPERRVSFKDVAGLDETVEEVKEVVDFLRHPADYATLGAKLPKGVLLVGPPGTGKTLLARAVAGEAGVPFFNLTGSDFVEMFVGVGAARVRDLFTEAKKVAPCIIFVDELDAVGRSRAGTAVVSSYDERENTLNQLLSEMDGFDPQIGIIIIGATNRPEILDAALLRPGRFDRHILVGLPDRRGRRDIFAIHVKPLSLSPNVDLDELAGLTPGLAGAEIANICNEAALLGKRKGHDVIDRTDFIDAIERGIAGLEKKNKVINESERRIIAYHESGHAIVGHFTPGADPVRKVSIVPRGYGALGYTLQSPLEDRYLMSRTELLGKIQGLLGGRAAEELVYGEVSTGASDDLEKIARIARDMITIYGMSQRLPNLSLGHRDQARPLGPGGTQRGNSEKLESQIDEEIREMIAKCYAEDRKLLHEKRQELHSLATLLLEKETIDSAELGDVLGPRPQR